MYFSLNKQLDDKEGIFECRMHFMRITCHEVEVSWSGLLSLH